ncbi:hypothetical protein DM02DRAFT_32260 [Periconia macrospinosa]|uniref:Uncharacterized protein n=1 Tax=Periconia macrospinosa TaxID=97972 RepID=A0A2V1DKR5_9PLEO|nr:hypothetical protein DM02DRAFT_32260 [Periconia macrospinosa]
MHCDAMRGGALERQTPDRTVCHHQSPRRYNLTIETTNKRTHLFRLDSRPEPDRPHVVDWSQVVSCLPAFAALNAALPPPLKLARSISSNEKEIIFNGATEPLDANATTTTARNRLERSNTQLKVALLAFAAPHATTLASFPSLFPSFHARVPSPARMHACFCKRLNFRGGNILLLLSPLGSGTSFSGSVGNLRMYVLMYVRIEPEKSSDLFCRKQHMNRTT